MEEMMATKKTGGTNSEENLNAVAEQLRKAAELLESSGTTEEAAPADTQEQEKPKTTKSTTAKKPAAKSTTAKSTATKSTAAKKPAAKSTTSKSTTKSTTSKSTATKSTAAKKPAAKKTAAEDDEVEKLKAELEAAKKAQADAEAAQKAAEEEAAHHAARAAKANANAEAEIAKANAEAEIAKAQAEAEKVKAAANADAEIAKANAEAEIAKAQAEAEIAKANANGDSAEPEAAATAETEEPKAEEEKPVQAEQAPAPAVNKRGAAKVAHKTNEFIHGKGKLPIFIVTNALFFVSAILLMFNAFSITGQGDTQHLYNIFTFLSKSSEVKTHLAAMAGDWANGAYVLLGIFMWIATILPLPFLIKNIIIAVRKKSFEVYKFDAVVFYSFMLFYLALVNLCGANVTFGLIAAFVVSAIDLVFVFLMQFITKSVKELPFFSFANIFLATLTILVLCGPTAKFNGISLYAALASDITGGGGIFVFLLFAIVALIALIIMQIWRLPKIVQIIIPLAAPVLAIIALITLGASVPKITGSFAGTKVSGQIIFGVILTIITAVANTLFTFLKPLNKFKKSIHEDEGAVAPAPVAAAETTTETAPATEEKAEAPAEEKAEEKPAEQPAEDNEPKVFCAACGEANSPTAAYCKKCGHRM